jgi:hypothetical protein
MMLTGDLCTIGELVAADCPDLVGVPAIQINMDGRIVTLTGLTRQECAAAAAFFMDRVTLSIDVA